MKALRRVGVPVHRRARSPRRPDELKGKTEQDALVAYLQNLGLAMKNAR